MLLKPKCLQVRKAEKPGELSLHGELFKALVQDDQESVSSYLDGVKRKISLNKTQLNDLYNKVFRTLAFIHAP